MKRIEFVQKEVSYISTTIDSELWKKVRIHCIDTDQSSQDYVRKLIEKDMAHQVSVQVVRTPVKNPVGRPKKVV
jgi:hypothetical protein